MLKIYKQDMNLMMGNRAIYSFSELEADPRFNYLTFLDTKWVISGDEYPKDNYFFCSETFPYYDLVTKYDYNGDLLHSDLSEEDILKIIEIRMQTKPITMEDITEALIDTNVKIGQNTDDLTLIMMALTEMSL